MESCPIKVRSLKKIDFKKLHQIRCGSRSGTGYFLSSILGTLKTGSSSSSPSSYSLTSSSRLIGWVSGKYSGRGSCSMSGRWARSVSSMSSRGIGRTCVSAKNTCGSTTGTWGSTLSSSELGTVIPRSCSHLWRFMRNYLQWPIE